MRPISHRGTFSADMGELRDSGAVIMGCYGVRYGYYGYYEVCYGYYEVCYGYYGLLWGVMGVMGCAMGIMGIIGCFGLGLGLCSGFS